MEQYDTLSTISKLQKVQNKCIELINGKSITLKNYQSLGILHLMDLIELEICKFGYKLVNGVLPTKIMELEKCDQSGKQLSKNTQL